MEGVWRGGYRWEQRGEGRVKNVPVNLSVAVALKSSVTI